MKPEFDEIDRLIFEEREVLYSKLTGPRVGDWVYLLGESKPRRFTHDWGDDIQVASSQGDCGSFYLGEKFCEYSGGLDPGIKKSKLRETDKFLPGRIWFFHHDCPTAQNGVEKMMEFKVWEQIKL